MTSSSNPEPDVTLRTIFNRWWPLACSWLLMGVELPAVTAVIARLPDADVNLAAYGGIVFPLCLLIEAPVIMLLATSTALTKDWQSYRTLRGFMNALGLGLTALHALVAFTPLWDFVAGRLLDAPAATIEPARTAMQLMTPWTWAIAIRRFQQGVLIRFGHSRAIGLGTVVRLLSGTTMLLLGWRFSSLDGAAVGACATATAVTCEALYVFLRVQPVLRHELRPLAPIVPALSIRELIGFHTPLALTSLFHLLTLPLGSAALGRMPASLSSLAVWPVVHGLTFIFRSLGLAYTELVVVLVERPRAYPVLWRFTLLLAGATSAGLFLVAATPLNRLWLVGVYDLSDDIASVAARALLVAAVLPGIGALSSFFQGLLVSARRTRTVSNAVFVALAANAAVLAVGLGVGQWTGLYVALAATVLGNFAQAAWLMWRSRSLRPTDATALT